MVGEGSSKDVATGAAGGAAVGSFFGPVGTAVGGGLGALGGWLFGGGGKKDEPAWTPEGYGWMSPVMGGQKESDMWGPAPWYMEQGTQMQAPTSQPVQAARGLGYGALAEEQNALDMLRRRASGEDSIARRAGERQVETAKRAILSAARSGRKTPAAARAAILQTSQAGQQVAGKIAEAEAQERLAAQQAYMAAASGMRGEALKQQMAEQDWWRTKADWERVKSEMLAKYIALGLSDKEAERRARMDYQTLLAQLHNKMSLHQDEMSQREKEAWLGFFSSGVQALAPVAAAAASGGSGGGGGGATTSDVRAKTNITPLSNPGNPGEKYRLQSMGEDDDVESLLDSITGYEFDYKPGYGSPGRQVGVMAQDLEQSPVGASMVSPTGPNGMKQVDYSPEKFNPIAMASLANLNERLRGVESRVGSEPNLYEQSGAQDMIMRGAGTTYNRDVPVAPQQGSLAGQTKPDINALKNMLRQMGGGQ